MHINYQTLTSRVQQIDSRKIKRIPGNKQKNNSMPKGKKKKKLFKQKGADKQSNTVQRGKQTKKPNKQKKLGMQQQMYIWKI